jgi:glycosyltransferase involved in cell wall biosynthesis
MTIAEAKILGLPIVSTNFDVIYDQIEHEKNGLIADMDGDSIGEQILRLVQNDELRERIKSAVLKEENTTYLTEVAKVENLIDRLTS